MPVREYPSPTLTELLEKVEQLEKENSEDKPGPWTAVTLSPKVEENAEYQSVAVRLENRGSVVRLRGFIVVKAGQTVEPKDAFITLPEKFRPPKRVSVSTSGIVALVQSNGFISDPSGNIVSPNGVALDDFTFTIL